MRNTKRPAKAAFLFILILSALLMMGTAVNTAQAVTAPTLVIQTTDTTNSVQKALTDLGMAFDLISTSDFSGVDLTPYSRVILGMDGGQVDAPSVQNAANYISNGGLFIIMGGTCYQPWANAVNTYLLQNDTSNYCWTVSSTPHLTVVDAANPLAAGLPATYNFANNSAAYYQIRSTDTATSVAAVNGDGYDAIFYKPIGSGYLVWFINSVYSSYWTDAADFAFLKTVVTDAVSGNFTPAPSFSVLTPNGGEEIPTGSTYRITWDAFSGGAPATAPAAALPVLYKVFHSSDSGATWTKLAGGLTSTSYDWYIPVQWGNTKRNLIKVVAYTTYVATQVVSGNTKLGEDVSDATFTISVVKVTSPEGGTVTGGGSAAITWDTYLTMRPAAQTAVQINCGTGWSTIATLSGNPGSYSWKVPAALKGASCKAKVILKDRTHAVLGADASNTAFEVK